MAPEVVFVINPVGWNKAFHSWTGTLGRWMARKTLEVTVRARETAPQPGRPPRNRTRINYATGELAASIVPDYGYWADNELEGRAVALPEHAVFVSKGTAPHIIRPKTADRLVFYWPKAGKVVHAKQVNHPGTAANPYMEEALESVIKVLR
jgi:hypothetical protein